MPEESTGEAMAALVRLHMQDVIDRAKTLFPGHPEAQNLYVRNCFGGYCGLARLTTEESIELRRMRLARIAI